MSTYNFESTCTIILTVNIENICTYSLLFFNLVYNESRNMEVLRTIRDDQSGGWGRLLNIIHLLFLLYRDIIVEVAFVIKVYFLKFLVEVIDNNLKDFSIPLILCHYFYWFCSPLLYIIWSMTSMTYISELGSYHHHPGGEK